MKPVEVVTDAAPIYPAVLEDLMPAAWHHVERHANNPIEAVPQAAEASAFDVRLP